MKTEENVLGLQYSEFEYQPTVVKNQFEIRPLRDALGETVVLEDKIATINPSRHDAEANAKLLAAAPEMLLALIEYVNSYEQNKSQMRAMRMAKAVIKKATE